MRCATHRRSMQCTMFCTIRYTDNEGTPTTRASPSVYNAVQTAFGILLLSDTSLGCLLFACYCMDKKLYDFIHL
jgi:hypothetical protein